MPDATANKIIPLLSEFHYQLKQPFSVDEFTLLPETIGKPELHFKVVKEELSRAVIFLSENADILYDSLSLSKTSWMKKNDSGQVKEGPGFSLSYLGFQTKDAILKNILVRQAIAHALPVQEWIQYKFFNWVNALPGPIPPPDLDRSKEELEQAGFPIQKNGLRFTLHYLTTPVREGNEMAFLVREALQKIQIGVEIQPLETSLFFSRLKRGEFQIFSSRMLRNNASTPIRDFLSPHAIRNYFQYEALTEPFSTWNEVKDQVSRDLPLIPLFTWKHAAVLSARLEVPVDFESKLDDSFRFLSVITLK